MPFTNPIKTQNGEWGTAHLKSFVVALSLCPTSGSEMLLDEFDVMGLFPLQSTRGQVAALNCQCQDDHSYRDG